MQSLCPVAVCQEFQLITPRQTTTCHLNYSDAVHGLNKRDTCSLVSFRGAAKGIFELWREPC